MVLLQFNDIITLFSLIKFIERIRGGYFFKLVVLNTKVADLWNVCFKLRVFGINHLLPVVYVLSSTKLRNVEVIMLQYLLETFLGTQPVSCRCKQLGDQIFRSWTLNTRKLCNAYACFHFYVSQGGTFYYVGVCVIVSERRLSCEKLINQDSKAIVIEFIRVALLVIHFWRHRMDCSTNGIGPLFVDLFCMAKVNHRHHPLLINHEIRSFDVSINVAILMKLLKNQPDLWDNEESKGIIEWTCHL